MPPEPTKPKVKRRTSRKDLDDFRFDGTHARELELKRTRGEVSCAECRRLKIKCDKQVPCQSCVRRGCVALCPNGSLATGQGTRFVLAATEHLHKRIAKLSGRVRQLEDALATLQAKHSTEPHPLLHEDYMMNDDREGEGETNDLDAAGSGGQTAEVRDSFGTLSISDQGVSLFFGPTGGSESLLSATPDVSVESPRGSKTPDSTRDSKSPMSIGELSLFSRFFPFTPVGLPPQVQQLIETQHLPSYEKAISLAEHYFAQVSWLFRGVTRSQVIDDMIPIIYRRQMPLPGEHYGGPHDLALLFCIFSISSLIGESPSAAYGDHYYQIARAALALQPVLEKPTMVTVQVLHLMSMYNAMSGSADMGGESSMETTWSLITLASNLSQTIGLHRDSVRWGLSPKMVQRRRILFWDLFVADVWQSLNTGRPPSFSLAYVDCRHPQYEDGGKTFATEFESWQFRFAAEVVAEVAARTLTAEAPSYATIMELDRKVREYPIPETANSSSSSDDFSTAFQRCVYEHIRETVLLYIHRSFFAQAIIDHPENPLKSTYSPSFSAAYQASSTILKSVQEHFNMYPQSSSIFWTMWTFAFSAAVVFGTVVTRGPRSPLAKSAMRELEQACILFSKASVYSTRATKALQILKTLSEKARLAMSSSQNDPSRDNGLHWAIRKDDDELSIFAGHTRFVNPKHTGETPPSSDNGGNASPEYNSPPTVQAVSSMPPVPQVRQPQPVQSSYRFEASVSPDVRMDTSEPAWPSQAESYDAAPRPRPSDQYGYHSNAPMGPGPSAPVAEYWVNTARDVSAARYDGPQHPSAPRISRPLQPPPQDHGYYHPPSPGDSAPVSLRSSHYYPPQSQGYAPAMYSNRQASTHIGNAPLSASSTSSSGQPFDMHTHQQSHPHPAEPSTAHPHPHPAHAPSSHAHPTQSHAHSSTPTYTQQYSMYPTTPAFHSQAGPPANNALADLGFASRDSRLDEKWGMFMSESGILEEINFRPS